VARFIYIDETGSVGKGAAKQPQLILVAVMVDEDKVKPLGKAMQRVAMDHLEWFPEDFEFHGNEIWGKTSWWSHMDYPALIAAYEAVIGLLANLELGIAYSTINKDELHQKYAGSADDNAYLLALQFLLEKIDPFGTENKVIVADEAKEHQFRAIKMVADMQQWGRGEVPGRQLKTIIDSLHFVQSHASPGVQMADLVAFIIQRSRLKRDTHSDAIAAVARLMAVINDRTLTWREPWPRKI
jgi:hypothetical protein